MVTRRAIAWLRKHADALIVVVIVVGLQGASLWSSASTREAQQHQGQVLEQKLCASFGRLAELKPPQGNPADNPSRAYLQAQHARLDELGTDLGCGRTTP